MSLNHKHVLVAAGGGIAAFKTVAVVRELGRRGAKVKVALTPSAARFVGPITFTGLTGTPAIVDLWDPSYAGEVHVQLADWADAIVVAPATANLIARAAHGFADDAVLATLSCAKCPVLLAPAMHQRMWQRPATQRNLAQLAADGYLRVGPVTGALANGSVGEGRMAEPEQIVAAIDEIFSRSNDLAGKTVLLSAGPTLEDLDPIRFISNRSSGRMGYAIAEVARQRGAEVVLVSGPTDLAAPGGVALKRVRSALEMRAAILEQLPRADIVIMTAAVADYRPARTETQKIKKSGDQMRIELVKNPDILAELGAQRQGRHPVLVGFAMETQDVAAYGRGKLQAKRVDLIVANQADVAFGGDQNQATLVSHAGDEPLPAMSKRALADIILSRANALAGSSASTTKSPPAPPRRAPAPARPRKGRSRWKA